ncbi:MAG: ATP-binding protein [Candidatus Methanomethylicia archaeon]
MVSSNPWFDDLDGLFNCRLRETSIKTSYEEGKIVLKSIIGILEASFNLAVLDRLSKPSFIAVERPIENDVRYLIYETFSVRPLHIQELSMDVSMPKALRNDFLVKIYSMWGDSEDTWIDIGSVYTGYAMSIVDDNIHFDYDPNIMPLVGAKAHLLSSWAIDKLVNVKDGVEIGELIGFQHKLKIDLLNLIKFHGGVFGFTGCGKSNLTSLIIRKVLNHLPNTSIIVIDVAGEYSINLLDEIINHGMIFSTEDFIASDDAVEAFLASQVIPESLEDKLIGDSDMREKVEYNILNLIGNNGIGRIDLEGRESDKLDYMLGLLDELRDDQNQLTKLLASELYHNLNVIIKKLSPETRLSDIAIKSEYREIKNTILKLVDDALYRLESGRSKTKFTGILEIFKEKLSNVNEIEEHDYGLSPWDIAELLMGGDKSRLIVSYVPDPLQARAFASKLISALFTLRKRSFGGPRILVVLDEAQEFIPDEVRKEDLTLQANIDVERLLRQGRKYRIHGWISTQRVARLNVNAIQQLHSYYAGTLPRSYDRHVIADASGISPEILDKTAQLDTGEWLFISHKATRRKNVALFIRAPNNEDILLENLSKISM